TLVNRSFYYSVLETSRYRNKLVGIMIGITILFTVLFVTVKPLSALFGLERPAMGPLLVCLLTGFVSVVWYEIVKFRKRRKG
ncbi:MAG TPA: cation-translocating P-type ATPase C-terminal domain-containing protein, partial [Ferruginibacter sp.]|nr:cation-translocating P-type ATPase C-terminal domain-containing protein [Ferruginibacter sp.]